MFTSYFSHSQIFWLAFITLLHIVSIYFFSSNRKINYAMLFLFIGGFIARFLLVGFDNFFHPWDEQYHALVSKNMAENNFIPMLFKNTPLPYDPNNWSSNHIWLHKQPMFLWQIALSIKIFGNSVIAVRLPSVIMSSLLILIVFRLGKIIINEQVGYISSLLYAVCSYLLDFNTGIYCTDHNDIAFMFYITLSIWAFTEYKICNKLNYVWLIGLFAGFAILNKWTVGLLVFSGWGVSIFFVSGVKNKLKEIKNILKAFSICLLICIPWQAYILYNFPKESIYEYIFSSKHLFEVIENHSGDYWYYFHQAIIQYGIIAAYLLPVAMGILFYDIKNKAIKISYIVYVVVVYLFFTIAKTKMPAFCLIISPILFLALGNIAYRLINYAQHINIQKRLIRSLEFLLLVIISLISMDFETIQRNHTEWINNDSEAFMRKSKIRISELGKSLSEKYDINNAIFFNCHETDNIPFMFFSSYTAYDKMPTIKECQELKSKGYKILIIDNYSGIPNYLKNDPEIVIIPNCKKELAINLRASNDYYFSDNDTLNHLLKVNRKITSTWETFKLIIFENNECVIRSYTGNFLCPELNNKNEITINRSQIGAWETFTIQYLNDDFVALKAFNEKYLSLNKKTNQLFATADSIGTNEKFKLTIAPNP